MTPSDRNPSSGARIPPSTFGAYEREAGAAFGAGTLRCPPHEWYEHLTVRRADETYRQYRCRRCREGFRDEGPRPAWVEAPDA